MMGVVECSAGKHVGGVVRCVCPAHALHQSLQVALDEIAHVVMSSLKSMARYSAAKEEGGV